MLMCPALTQANFDALRARLPDIDVTARLTGKLNEGDLDSPAAFVAHVRDSLAIAYANGVREYHIHNEPNLPGEGYLRKWHNGRDFAAWWIAVRNDLDAQFPGCRWGFPALSPNDHTYWTFMQDAAAAVQLADILGVHVYWWNAGAQMQAVAAANNFAATYPDKPIHVTEFSRPSGDNYAAKGAEYVKFYGADWRPNVEKLDSFTLYASGGWITEAWAGTEIPAVVGARTF